MTIQLQGPHGTEHYRPERLTVERSSLQTNSFQKGRFRFFQGSSPPLAVHPISEPRGTQFWKEGVKVILSVIRVMEHDLKGVSCD